MTLENNVMTGKQNNRLESILIIIAILVFIITTISFLGKVNCQQRYKAMLVRFDIVNGCEIYSNNLWVKGN